jgi:hypothetical protein
MKNILLAAIVALTFFSCEKTITLDLEQTEEVLVIEGLLTDSPDYQYVKLSKTVAFNATGRPTTVSGAEVTVEDATGQVYTYEEVEAGYYVPVDNFVGELGNTYTLKVKSEGKEYTATDEMYYVPPFDSLSSRIDFDELDNPDEEGLFYEVLFYIKEPQETKDYYLLKVYRNDTLQNWDGEGVFYTDDTFLSANIGGFPAPIYYSEGDMAKLEMYSISREGYIHFLDLESNINNDGGMFAGQPANVRSNIEGGAVGHFQVSALSVAELSVGK